MTVEEFKIKVIPVNSKLYQFARRLLNNKEEAEDVVQEIFLKLWNIRDKLETLNSIEAYAMRMTRNFCIDKLKTTKTVSLETKDYKMEIANAETAPDNQLVFKETVEKVKKIINKLPEQQKTIIELRDRDGYSLQEIAEIMKMNAVNVRVNLSRARKKVKEVLINNYDYGSGKSRNIAGEVL